MPYAQLPLLPEAVKNETFGCWLIGTAHMGLIYHFRMKLSSEKNAFFDEFAQLGLFSPFCFHSQVKKWLKVAV
jgi:hypothetical protein